MQLIDPKTCWWADHKLLITWHPLSRYQLLQLYGAHASHVESAQLWLIQHNQDCHTLHVQKNRLIQLQDHVTMLDQVFEEYEIETDPWRGQIKLSDAESCRWKLIMS
jgi:hypothetical protein